MLRILAMVGDAQASSHVRTALDGYADLVFARHRAELAHALDHDEPDIIVLGIREAADATIRLTVRETIERRRQRIEGERASNNCRQGCRT